MRLFGGGLSALLCVAAVGLTACGSSGGSDFAAQANAICKESSAKSAAIFQSPAGQSENRQGAIKLEQSYVALDEKTDRKMKALEVPADAQKAFAAYLKAGAAVEENDRKLLQAAKEGDPDEYGKLQEKEGEVDKAADKAAAAVGGLEACANELPEAEAKEVARTIEKNETEANPAQCTDYFTEMAVKQQWKTLKGCREYQEGETDQEVARAVDVKVTEGVEGVRATADVTFHGGQLDGKTLEFGLVDEGGAWKVVFGHPKEG